MPRMFAEEIIAFADFIMAREHGLLLYPDACTDLNHNVYYHTGHLVSDTGLVSVFFIYTFCTKNFALSLSRSLDAGVCEYLPISISATHFRCAVRVSASIVQIVVIALPPFSSFNSEYSRFVSYALSLLAYLPLQWSITKICTFLWTHSVDTQLTVRFVASVFGGNNC